MANVRLINVTPDAEQTMIYCARVSNPNNQDNPNYSKLLKYCIKNGHWSVLEMAHMTVEIETSRAIAAQILRHKSFSFQEFSQRYAEVQEEAREIILPRRQDAKNRQNSIDDLPPNAVEWFLREQEFIWNLAQDRYKTALQLGIAKECARFLLPGVASTRLYMTGNMRSWYHYLLVRLHPSTQKEHRDIAKSVLCTLKTRCPILAELLEQELAVNAENNI